jgi:hypothetical protein
VLATDGDQSPPVNFQAGMQQPGILQPAEPDSLSIGHRRFTEEAGLAGLCLGRPVVLLAMRPCVTLLTAAATLVASTTALDNGFTVPPRGWSALYGAPFNSVNETMLMRAAEGLNKSGLLAKGYEYVTIDDWWATRDNATGDIMGVPDKFPSGMKAIGQAIHAQNAKFGV